MTLQQKKQIRIWYLSGAVLVFLILIVGGITRLTDSGLSIVEWSPIMGAIPPLNEIQWEEAFDKYKQYPEYQEHNAGMSMAEFQFIFFWEYLHRFLGRLVGIFFIIPFGYFLVKKAFDKTQFRRSLFLLTLGFAQGFMGWYMVKSGLVDVPMVSPYRLAAHLSLAIVIFGACLWFAIDLYERRTHYEPYVQEFKKWIWGFFALLGLQIIWGAFVAGLDAGHVYNTFPKMYARWVPAEAWILEPFVRNLTENPAAVQFIHRLLGSMLAIYVIAMWGRVFRRAEQSQTRNWALVLFALLLGQYALGVFTLIYHVPVWLGVTHQAFAIIIFGAALIFYRHLLSCSSENIASQNQ